MPIKLEFQNKKNLSETSDNNSFNKENRNER